MKSLEVTCDRADGLTRAAVWSGKELLDLYVSRTVAPDFSGAVVCGKVVRVLPGQKAGWIDAGLPEKIYVESPEGLRVGEEKTVCILSTLRGGKAWPGALTSEALRSPLSPWERAMADTKGKAVFRFGSKEDFDLFEKSFSGGVFSKESVHPELDEMIERLLAKEVSLTGGASLVIEETEALVAIDVNVGEKGSALSVNLLAMREVARQIRLRNFSGIIVIDALKMKDRTDKAKMLNVLSRACEGDPAGANVFGVTKLGLVEMTRSQKGPSLATVMRGA